MSDTSTPQGLPAPPAAARARCRPAPTTARPSSSPAAAPGSARRSRASSPRLGANIVIGSRKAEHREAGEAAMAELGAPVLTVECDIRDADSIAAMFDAAVERFGLPRRAREQRGGELPGAGRGHVAERVAHRRRHHAHRHVPVQPRVRPSPPRRGHARVDHRRRRVVRLDGRPRASRTPRPPRPA